MQLGYVGTFLDLCRESSDSSSLKGSGEGSQSSFKIM